MLLSCGARGPQAEIAGDFDAAEQQVLELWSRRAPGRGAISSTVVNRIRTFAALARAMGQLSDEDIFADVRVADIQVFIKAVTPE